MNPEEENLEDGDVNLAVSSLMQDLPKPVQDFLASEERGSIVRELSNKYSLHVDQAGEFERAFLFMLLGISKPEEFVSSLSNIGLSQEVINGLATDVNTQVFMKLRDSERRPTPTKPAPLPPPSLNYEPSAPTTLPGSPIPAPMPTPTQTPTIGTIEPTPTPQVQGTQQHIVHSMPNTGVQPGWHPAAAVHIFVPTHGPNAAPQYQLAPTPPPVPVYETPVIQPVPQPLYINPIEAAPLQPPPPIKHYAEDPYRESPV